MKDLKKCRLDDEALKNVSGGAGEGLDNHCMQALLWERLFTFSG